jgi:hypothetical protein
MTDEDIELLLYRILCGKLFFNYNGEKYELRSPNYFLKYDAQLLYNNIINEEKYNDWIREENLVNILIGLGLWTKDTMSIIKDLEKKIDNTKVDLFKSVAISEKVKVLRKSLLQFKQQLAKILNIRHDFTVNTLEGYALSIKNEFIICNTLFKNNKRLFTKTLNNNQNEYTYFNNLVNEINKNSISIEDFKRLVRHQLWKNYWTCNKVNVFNSSVADLTDEQRTLINLSRMYDSVYDHPDCPPESVINDDDMLDGWMILQKRKSDQSKNQHKIDTMNPKLKNAQEVFLMANNQESFEEIMSLNSPESKRRMQEKFAYLDTNGSASDLELPDVQRELLNKANEIRKNR